MKVAIFTKINHIEIQDWPTPQIDDEKVLIKVIICGICGSDLAALHGSGHKKYPYSPGHEFCGTIEKMGKKVTGLQIGQRVVVNPNLGCGQCRFCRIGKPNLCDSLKSRPVKSNGGLSEYVALDYRMVYPLPEDFPDELAPFIEPLSCAIYAAKSANSQTDDKVAVFGAGIMGILTGLALKSYKCSVVFVEPAEKRRDHVKKILDLPAITPQELDKSELKGNLDITIDCSGRIEAVSQAIRSLRKLGRLILAGIVINTKGAELPLVDVTTREIEIKGIWLNPDTFKDAVQLAYENRETLQKFKTEKFKLNDITAAFEKALDTNIHKVLVTP